MAANTYSFLDCLATITGPGGGFSLGAGAGVAKEGITVSYAEDKATLLTGADGSYMHSLHASRSGTVTVRLLKTSPTNALLDAKYRYQTTSSANYGQDTITVTDPVRGDTTVCEGAGFKKKPDIVYSEDGQMMEWVWNVGAISQILGNGSAG